jgi:Cu-Zn family superoxide dismutase
MHYLKKSFLALICLMLAPVTFASSPVTMRMTVEKGQGDVAGTVTITETKYGLLFTPNLHGLTPGVHGFHIHQNFSCSNNGMAAGGHFDPNNTPKHLGPYNDLGHLGDLPVIYVNADGTSVLPIMAPRLKHLSDISRHALMIHHAGDNYLDTPEKLGGGGARMVCGLVD